MQLLYLHVTLDVVSGLAKDLRAYLGWSWINISAGCAVVLEQFVHDPRKL